MFLINSRLGLLIEAHKGWSGMRTSPHGHPLFLSYRVKLSSSLTRVLSFTWGHLPLPTCVGLRYGHQNLLQRSFSRRHRIGGILQGSGPKVLDPLSSCARTDFPILAWPSGPNAPCPCPSFALKREISGTGILTRCPSLSLVRYSLGPTYPTLISIA